VLGDVDAIVHAAALSERASTMSARVAALPGTPATDSALSLTLGTLDATQAAVLSVGAVVQG
jgi:hypothetical protein